jgi:hypothetical protein
MPSPTDVDALVRCADPAAEPSRMDEVDALLAQAAAITAGAAATPPRRRRPPRRLLVAVPIAAAALLFAVPMALNHGGGSLAARAYAATDPGDQIVHEVAVMTIPPGEGGPATMTNETWYRPSDGTARSIQSVPGHSASEAVHDADGVVHFTTPEGTTETVAPETEAARQRIDWTRSVTLTFRRDYEQQQLRDDGMTTLDGRPVHAYSADRDTWYIDPDTALPVGQREMVRTPPDPTWRPVTMVIKTYEQLPPTPENLAKLR